MTDGGGEIPYTFACVAFIFHLKNLRTARFFVKKYGPHGGGGCGGGRDQSTVLVAAGALPEASFNSSEECLKETDVEDIAMKPFGHPHGPPTFHFDKQTRFVNTQTISHRH